MKSIPISKFKRFTLFLALVFLATLAYVRLTRPAEHGNLLAVSRK